MKKRNYKLEWFFLFSAIGVSLISLSADLLTDSTTMFARSGSIAVLLAAIVEYRTSSHFIDDLQRAEFINSIKNKVVDYTLGENDIIKNLTAVKPKPTKERRVLSLTAHIILIIGTFVWGYGDLLFSAK